jgi:hypothetical protein
LAIGNLRPDGPLNMNTLRLVKIISILSAICFQLS